MMELPLSDTISLQDTVAFHRALVHSGASIAEINCVRKHFSAVKGGRLGQAAAAIPNLSIIVSDVPGGRLDALASGPTLPDTSTVSQCKEVLNRFDLLPQFPASVQRFFHAPTLPETPKPGSFPARSSLFSPRTISPNPLAQPRNPADSTRSSTTLVTIGIIGPLLST